MKNAVKNILNFDPCEFCEKRFGDRSGWTENEKQMFISVATSQNIIKTYALRASGDTYLGVEWLAFLEIARKFGFREGYRKAFIGSNGQEEEEVILFHEALGLVLYAESFGGNSVNSAKVYGEVLYEGKLTNTQWDALDGTSHGASGDWTVSFDVDVREGLVFQLERIAKAFKFSLPWKHVPFLWLLNYTDTKEEGYDHRALTAKKLEMCSSEVREIIFGKRG